MGELDVKTIKDRLVRELGYPPAGAQLAATRLVALSDATGEAFRTQ